MKKLVRISPEELLKKYSDGERDFRYTKLRGGFEVDTSLKGAYTSGSDWRGVNLNNVDLTDSVNRGTDFSGIQARYATFYNSDSRESRFNLVDIFDSQFVLADLRGASFYRPKRLEWADWQNALLRGAYVKGVSQDVVFGMIRMAKDSGVDKMSAKLRREIYSIAFHYIPGESEEKVSEIRRLIDRPGEIKSVFPEDTPFQGIVCKIWKKHSEEVEPKPVVTKKEITEVRKKLIELAGLVA